MLSQPWQIRLLGRLEARQGETVVSRFATRHVARLFVYLSGNVGKSVSREAVTEMLWPEVDLETGRNRLRVALASIRRLIELPGTRPGSVLIADRSHLELSSQACRVDAHEFRRMVTRGLAEPSQQKAAELLARSDEFYEGPFCDGLDEDDWIADERYSLTHLQVTGQIRLGEILAQTGDFDRAIRHARRAVHADPLSEPARRVTIRLLLAQGKQDEAVLELREFERVLKRETGLSPSPETMRLLPGRSPERSASPVGTVHDGNSRRGDRPSVLTPAAAEPPLAELADKPVSQNALNDRLPQFLDKYVERLDELSSLEALVTVSRIVTLTGPGGIGKTRLAVELIRSAANSFGSGIWFVPVPLENPSHLLELVVQAIAMGQTNSEEPLTLIASVLGKGRLDAQRPAGLIVIDGAEHLPESAGLEIRALLRAAPNLTLLITSRRKLGVVGEQEHEVKPLDVANLDFAPNLKEISGYPSIRLFVERAQAVQPDFQLTATNAPFLAQICDALDGIPLAIELAAAQIRRVPLRSMGEHLGQLKSSEESRSWRPSRQRSLQTTLTWTFDALSADAKTALVQLSIFRRSWDLEAAEALLTVEDPRGALESLLQSFLIVRETVAWESRYRMLNSVRDFAAARLTPEETSELAERHAAHFMQRAVRFAASIPAGVFGHNMLVQERENFQAALSWYASRPELPTFVSSLTWHWVFHGGLSEGQEWVQNARRTVRQDDRRGLAQLDLSEGILACYQDRGDIALDHLKSAAEVFGELGDSNGESRARWAMGYAEFVRGNFVEARRLLSTSLAELDLVSGAWWAAACHNLLGFAEFGEQNMDEAERHFQSSREIWSRIGERVVTAQADLGLAKVAWKKGNYERAEALYKSSLEQFQSRSDYRGMTYSIEGLARVLASAGRSSLAARLLGAAQRLRETHGLQLDATDSKLHEDAVDSVKAKLIRRFDPEWSIGYGLNPEAVARYAATAS